MKKYGNTNSEGLCTVKNPCISKYHKQEYSELYPPLPLYTPSGELVKDVENVEVEGPVNQSFTLFGWVNDKELSDWALNFYIKKRTVYILTVPPMESEEAGTIKINDVIKVFLDLPQFDQIKIIRHIMADDFQNTGTFPRDYFTLFFAKYKEDYGVNVNPLLSTIEGCGFKVDRPAITNNTPMSSKGIKSAEEMLKKAHKDHPDCYFPFTKTVSLHEITIIKLMEAYHAQFATEAGGESHVEQAEDVLALYSQWNYGQYRTQDVIAAMKEYGKQRDGRISELEYKLTSLQVSTTPSNNSSSEMVEEKP